MRLPYIPNLLVEGYGKYKVQFGLLVLSGILSGVFEIVGITAIIPLFAKITGVAGASNAISGFVETFLGWFGLGLGLKVLLFFMAIAFILKAIILVSSNYLAIKISEQYQRDVRSQLFRGTLQAKWKFLINQKSGNLTTFLIRDVAMSGELFASLGTVVIFVASLAIYAIAAFLISPQITLASFALGLLIFLVTKPLLYRTRELSRQAAYTYGEMVHHTEEHVGGLKSIKAAAVEEHAKIKADAFFDLIAEINKKVNLFRIVSFSITEPVSVMFVGAIFAFSYLTGNFHIGEFAVTIYLIHRIFLQLNSVQAILYKLNSRIPHLQRIVDFQKELSSSKEISTGVKPFVFQDALEFTNVRFSYEAGEREVLHGVNFRLPKGAMIGLVGHSGSGKTTLVDLMMRLIEPAGGEIVLDGTNISEIKLDEWRSNIGYVAQEGFVLNDTIERNIRFYNENITSEEIINAAKKAYIYDFVLQQPKGFQTAVGEHGVLLSGGERQRLILARALAQKPSILILDEATSALDNESEFMIQKAIEGLRGTTTIFVIAHRLSTLLNCDTIFVLEEGKITEQGPSAVLLKNKKSYFYRMYNIRDNEEEL